mgnify:FL=1
MLQLIDTCLSSKDNNIVQKTTIKGCTASAEMINSTLKRFPFDASVVQNSCDGKNKETIVYIHLSHEVSLRIIDNLEEIIMNMMTDCERVNAALQEFDNTIEALVKDSKMFGNETTKSNSSTAKKVSDF